MALGLGKEKVITIFQFDMKKRNGFSFGSKQENSSQEKKTA